MPEPLVTTGAALVGASAWFLNKIFGPSAEAIGDQIKLYASDRLSSIFGKAEKTAGACELNATPAGFAVQFLQKASVSEDEENLTEMWANLLISASKDFTNRHAIFVDILSQINSFDARRLNKIVPAETVGGPQTQMPLNQKSSLRHQFQAACDWPAANLDDARDQYNKLLNFALGWPGSVTLVSFPYYRDHELCHMAGGYDDRFSSLDAMFRQGLIDKFSFDLGEPSKSLYIEGFLVTALGVRFTQTCRGVA